MRFLITWGLPFLAALISILGLYLAGRGMLPRRPPETAFNVARLETRLARRNDLLRGVGAILLGALLLLFVALWGDLPGGETAAPLPTPTVTSTMAPTASPTAEAPTAVQTLTPSASPAATAQTPATATPLPAEPTETGSPVPIETAMPQTAVVTSGVGVWLRATPGTEGEQLERVLEGTEIILLGQTEIIDELTWEYIQTPAGNLGWVAAPFIEINLQPTNEPTN